MPKYQGHDVEVLRDAKEGDEGFNEGQDQVLIRLPNGEERVVQRNEVGGP